MRYVKSVLFLCVLLLQTTCTNSWIAYPVVNKPYEMCNPHSSSDLQMVFVPGFDKTVVITEDCEYFRRERLSIALTVFETMWEETFGKNRKIKRNFRELVVTFSFVEKTNYGYSVDGNYVESTDILGSAISKNSIWLYVDHDVDRICDTALVHELVHTNIWVLNGVHGDPDHTGNMYYGWSKYHNIFIDKVNKRLCTLGI